jgi:hypothetical protein
VHVHAAVRRSCACQLSSVPSRTLAARAHMLLRTCGYHCTDDDSQALGLGCWTRCTQYNDTSQRRGGPCRSLALIRAIAAEQNPARGSSQAGARPRITFHLHLASDPEKQWSSELTLGLTGAPSASARHVCFAWVREGVVMAAQRQRRGQEHEACPRGLDSRALHGAPRSHTPAC